MSVRLNFCSDLLLLSPVGNEEILIFSVCRPVLDPGINGDYVKAIDTALSKTNLEACIRAIGNADLADEVQPSNLGRSISRPLRCHAWI